MTGVDPGSPLAGLAAVHGVSIAYVDGTGVERRPPAATVEAAVEILRAANPKPARPKTSRTLGESRGQVPEFPQSSEGRCHPGPQGPRTWGLFAPLAGLRSDDRPGHGLGDLTTLRELADVAIGMGARVVGTLPLLATRPDEASPYSPLTRHYFDERWVDPAWVAGRLGVPAPRPRPAAAADRTDPRAAWESTRIALRALFDAAGGRSLGPEPDADAWRWARWRAAVAVAGADVARWDRGLERGVRDGGTGALEKAGIGAIEVAFESFCQQAVAAQLGELSSSLRAEGAALYLDLPVGTAASGYDVWEAPGDFAVGMSIGAPPDRFFPEGQSWGLVPPLPGKGDLRRSLDAHMAVCGLLRIDHVMGLHRLFWVPDGGSAADGTYVASPAAANWELVAELSRAHECGVVGEDLGTVPEATREAMEQHGARGLFIGQDEVRAPFRLDRPVPRGVVASLNTHDLPPVAAWHRAREIKGDVGPDEDAPVGVVRDHLAGELAMSEADVVLLSEQDLSLDERRVNVPGRVGGDVWRVRSRLSVADLRDGPAGDDARRVCADVDRWRRTERGTWPAGTAPLLDDGDVASLHAGTHALLADRFGVHPVTVAGVVGVSAAVWAPHAQQVAIAGDFDGWSGALLRRRDGTGVWEGFIPAAVLGDRYKVNVRGADGEWVQKCDPFSRASELPPDNASIITADDPAEGGWGDQEWMTERSRRHGWGHPMSIYELHLGSWRRHADGRVPTYAEVAPWIVEYVLDMGFTHVELMPVMEHPFGGSWGYHVSGYFAPTIRYGTPAEFAGFVDTLHRAGIGVILDWVPAHFPDDLHGLADFDGQALYEYADPREGRHPEWGSRVFDWGRPEVRAFLVSSARWWLERYHVDGLRVDAVASMLYRDYGRRDGEWIANTHGGRENLEAVDFVRQLTTEIHNSIPGALVIAEESTAWPGVTHPTVEGGLGFDLKWDLGWMHDMLQYLARDSVHRQWHQDDITFRAMYAHSERFVLPLSHDEVVHGKGSLVGKMSGDDWQRRANLRLLYGHQYTVPGVPLIFMGGELAMNEEWDHDTPLPWYLLDHRPHHGVQRWVAELNRLLSAHPALAGRRFEWLDCDDRAHSVLSWVRRGPDPADDLVVVANFTPAPHEGYRIGLPTGGEWRVVANSDEDRWGGSGFPTPDRHEAQDAGMKQWRHSAMVSLPPLGLLILERVA